jgi:anthranilate phosphoribosyltransferase
VSPDDFRIRPVALSDVAGGEGPDAPAVNAQAMREVLGGKIGPLTGFVTLNAAAALLAADEVPTFAEGVSRAAECIDDGRALRKLERFVTVSQELGAAK